MLSAETFVCDASPSKDLCIDGPYEVVVESNGSKGMRTFAFPPTKENVSETDGKGTLSGFVLFDVKPFRTVYIEPKL